jgi:CheY-like chemotaxis protein
LDRELGKLDLLNALREKRKSHKKVLVVDDNKDTISILTTILKIAGCSVITAQNGIEAMQQIQLENPSLVLLDIMMPKMDGFEVCKAVKNNPDLRHIPIVMVSAKRDEASKYRAQRLGADDFINKPILPSEILRKVRNF